jgi:hypothetical protein
MKILGFFFFAAMVVSLCPAQQRNKATITGEVIDTKCYMLKGEEGRGKDHKECALKCAKAGVPLAILQEKTNLVYFTAKARGMSGANEMLMPFVAERVSVTGTVVERGGVKMLFIDSIEKKP